MMSAHRFRHVAGLLVATVVLSACAVQLPVTPAPAAGAEMSTTPVAAAEAEAVATAVQPDGTTDVALAIVCDGQPTPAQTEGPYYTPNPPQRASLIEEGVVGDPITLTGYVLDTECRPIAGAVVDFWQADGAGVYDNEGYRLRGYTLTDDAGRYVMETVVPGEYPGRTPHIHVKVQPPGGAVLTSQMYFPDEAANARDGIFNPALILDLQKTADGLTGVMNFIVTP